MMTELNKEQALVPYDADGTLVPAVGELVEEVLTQTDYLAIKDALASGNARFAYRNILLCKVLRATGLRINELVGETKGLTPERFGQEGPYFYLLIQREKKAGVPQWERVYLSPLLGVELRDYIRGLQIAPGRKVFPIKARMVRLIFAEAGRRAIGRPVHPHEFRGLYIKTLLDGGLPSAAAAKMVGHTSSRTTEAYYYKLNRDQRAEIQRRIPV